MGSTKIFLDRPIKSQSNPKKSKRGGKRSESSRKKAANKKVNLSILGANSAGLKAKRDSVTHVIKSFNYPSCLTFQETKLRQRGSFQIRGYQVFEKIRTSTLGGGLLTAVNQNLNPFEIESQNEEAEILVVQFQLEEMKVRLFNAYGPQEDDTFEKRVIFWQALETEIATAKRENCLILLELDANAKLGYNVIRHDPHPMSENGRLLYDLLERESLILLNTSSVCEGVITRHKDTKNGTEKSVLDYVIACERLAKCIKSMKIDEDRIFVLTKYATSKGIKSIVKSDHNTVFADFHIEYNNISQKKPRVEVFNVKNKECQEVFRKETEQNAKLKQCFASEESFQIQSDRFFKTLKSVVHKCFNKVRVGTKLIEDKDIRELLNEQTKLKKSMKNNHSEIFQKQSLELEKKIAERVADRNAKIVKEYVDSMNFDGKFSPLGMWKLKNRLMPREYDVPMGKLDEVGNLVTVPSALRSLYLNHYQERLKHKKIKDEYIENYDKKVLLWDLRYDYLKENKSNDWTEENLELALKSLKSNKTRDPSGYINELFKQPVIGQDLKIALLSLVNGIKKEFYTPFTMQMANITTIYKKKGSKHLLENDRGIFILSVFRKIIDRLIYQELYPMIDEQMSDCNIGGRKNRNIKNHLFIVYAIINSVIKSGKCIDIQIYDLVKAFDVLWLEDSLNDLWDTLPAGGRTDKLGLVYKTNKDNFVAVNTAVGQTDRVNIPRIITQGGTWGPILCSNSIDKVGKIADEKGLIYKYKDIVKITPLAMIDDLLAVSRCGIESIEINLTINTIIELKKLEFHRPDKKGKCHYMHVGKPNQICPGMKVHGRKAGQVSEATYLGDIIRADGKNTSNVKSRTSKGVGIITEIMSVLKGVSFGHRYFEIAIILREARLINGILTNAEIWYSLGRKEIEDLEQIDRIYLRQVLNAPRSVSSESLYLELGIIPISIIIKTRRLSYLHYLANLEPSEMLYKVFITQWKFPVKDDWTEQVKIDMKEFGLGLSLDELKLQSKNSFKRKLKTKSKEVALQYLLKLKEGHSKMANLNYDELKMQEYLKDPRINVAEAQNVFRFRTRSAQFKDNYKSMYSIQTCPLCQMCPDTQTHSFECKEVIEKVSVKGTYEEIFGKKIKEEVSRTIFEICKLREKYFAPQGGPSASTDAAK